jgi:hypothetical protein
MSNIDILGILKDNFKDLLYILGAIGTFLVGRRLRGLNEQKTEVSIQTSELDNVEAALKIYRTMLSDLQVKVKEAEEAYTILESRYQKSLEEKRALIEENKILKQRINEITSNS